MGTSACLIVQSHCEIENGSKPSSLQASVKIGSHAKDVEFEAGYLEKLVERCRVGVSVVTKDAGFQESRRRPLKTSESECGLKEIASVEGIKTIVGGIQNEDTRRKNTDSCTVGKSCGD